MCSRIPGDGNAALTKTQAQLNAQQQLARELERAGTEERAAQSGRQPRRVAAWQHPVDTMVKIECNHQSCSKNKSVRARDVTLTYPTDGAGLACCWPPSPRGHHNIAVGSRSRVRAYAAALHSGSRAVPHQASNRKQRKIVFGAAAAPFSFRRWHSLFFDTACTI